jgi:hypothetical protein
MAEHRARLQQLREEQRAETLRQSVELEKRLRGESKDTAEEHGCFDCGIMKNPDSCNGCKYITGEAALHIGGVENKWTPKDTAEGLLREIIAADDTNRDVACMRCGINAGYKHESYCAIARARKLLGVE